MGVPPKKLIRPDTFLTNYESQFHYPTPYVHYGLNVETWLPHIHRIDLVGRIDSTKSLIDIVSKGESCPGLPSEVGFFL